MLTSLLIPGVRALAAPVSPLTAGWRLRSGLEEQGISPFANWTIDGMANVSGGSERKAWGVSLLDFGIELDTAKLGWWESGAFKLQGHWLQNFSDSGSFDAYTGAFNPSSSLFAANHIRVYNLFYQHQFGDAAVLKFGQIAVDDDFMLSDYTGLFLNSAFGPMPSQVGTPLASRYGSPPAFPIYSILAPGVFLQVRPVENFSSQLGLYYGRVGFDAEDNFGFDWASQSPAELALFWESGLSYTLSGRTSATKLGLSYHTGRVDDFADRAPRDSAATTQNVPNFYLVQDLAVLRDSKGDTKLGAFARLGITPEPGSSMVCCYADAGLNWLAPFRHRAQDIAGLAVSHTTFGRDYRRSTAPDGVASSQATLELTYRAQLTCCLSLQADVQVLFNPTPTPGSGSRETAAILGLRTVVQF